MHIENLVKMANQIGQFFEAEPDRNQAVKDIALHLKRFWDPRMRSAIIAHVDQGGAGLMEIVATAISSQRELLGTAQKH
ncbi:NADH-dependent formate dehydrogenase delta subunit FdsD [mine drainage metagenome]|uniref:NADH-dependent formate dehydrogenase delta subunit FdsD n=1 Tax=mine drainage metagenome TaxID=410659 RepID=A0A1J5R168_9ZZZZ